MMLNKNISFLGLMSTVAALLQISAGFFPVVGHLLSVFSTLPMIFAAHRGWKHGISAYLSTAFIILMIQPAEVLIFLFMTGLLGVSLGLTLYYKCASLYRIIVATLSLAVGMTIASIIFAIPIFGGITVSYSVITRLIFYFLFSLPYSLLWIYFSEKIIKKINPTVFMLLG